MSKKKTGEPAPAPAKKDQHKSSNMVRLPDDVYLAMKAEAEANDRPLTREVVRALTAYLEARGKWPPTST
jgi:hypothetical protein